MYIYTYISPKRIQCSRSHLRMSLSMHNDILLYILGMRFDILLYILYIRTVAKADIGLPVADDDDYDDDYDDYDPGIKCTKLA